MADPHAGRHGALLGAFPGLRSPATAAALRTSAVSGARQVPCEATGAGGGSSHGLRMANDGGEMVGFRWLL